MQGDSKSNRTTGTEATGSRVVRFPVERRQARRLVTLTELREQLGGSERWWRYRITEGLPRHAWGRLHRFDPDEVVAWLDGRAA
jgi:hypothetical protein